MMFTAKLTTLVGRGNGEVVGAGRMGRAAQPRHG
jgi:hypothetical protein